MLETDFLIATTGLDCEINLAGIELKGIYWIEQENILGKLEVNNSIQTLVLKEGSSFKNVDFVQETGRYNERQQRNAAHGVFYNCALSFVLAKDSKALTTLRDQLKNRKVAIAFKDGNGYFRMLEDMLCLVDHTTATGTGRNQLSFSFTKNRCKPAAEFNVTLEPVEIDCGDPLVAGQSYTINGAGTQLVFQKQDGSLVCWIMQD